MEEKNKPITLSELFPSLQQIVWIVVTVVATLLFIIRPVWEMRQDFAVATAELKRTTDELAKTNASVEKLASLVNENERQDAVQEVRLESLERRNGVALSPAPDDDRYPQYSIRTEPQYKTTIQATKPEEEKKKEEETDDKGEAETILGVTGRTLDEGLKNFLPKN